MTGHYFIQAIFLIAGMVSLLAAIFNWNWFFDAKNTKYIVANAGRTRARLFYAAIGLLMAATGIFFFTLTLGAKPL